MKKKIYSLFMLLIAAILSPAVMMADQPAAPYFKVAYNPTSKMIELDITVPSTYYKTGEWTTTSLPEGSKMKLEVFRLKSYSWSYPAADAEGVTKISEQTIDVTPITGSTVTISDDVAGLFKDGEQVYYLICTEFADSAKFDKPERSSCKSDYARISALIAQPKDVKFAYDAAAGAVKCSATAPTSWASADKFLLPDTGKINIVFQRRNHGTETYTDIHTSAALAPGESYSYNDTVIEKGVSYDYRSYAKMDTIVSDKSSYSEVLTGIKPASATKLRVSTEKGKAPVLITCFAPVKDYDGKEMPADTKLTLKLGRQKDQSWGDNWTPVAVLENVAPGDSVSFTDNSELADGQYYYQVKTFCGSISDYGTTGGTVVGIDKPKRLADGDLTVVINGTTATITWKPVTAGAENGYIIPEEVRYNVLRVYENGTPDTIAVGLDVCTATDDLSDLTKPMKIAYKVIPYNATGEAPYPNAGEWVVAGPALELPFVESFGEVPNSWGGVSIGFENLWDSKYPVNVTGYLYKSNPGASGLSERVTAVKGEKDGALYWNFYSETAFVDGGDHSATTCGINIKTAVDPVLTFYVYNIKNSRNQIFAEAVVGDEVVELYNYKHNNEGFEKFADDAPEQGGYWDKVTVALPMDKLADAETIKLRFRVPVPEEKSWKDHWSMMIDEISLVNTLNPVSELKGEATLEAINLTWTAPASDKVTGYTVATVEKAETELLVNGNAATDDAQSFGVAGEDGRGWGSPVRIADGAFYVECPGDKANPWDCQLFIKSNHEFVEGEKFTFSMKYKADVADGATRSIQIQAQGNPGGYKDNLAADIKATNEYQEYLLEHTVTAKQAGMKTIAFNLATDDKAACKFSFMDFSWKAMEYSVNNVAEVLTAEPITTTGYTFANPELDKVYGFAVTAHYGKLKSEPVMVVVAAKKAAGLDSVAADEVVAVRYFGLNGMELAAPSAGTVAVKVTTYANGTVATEKVLVK